MMQITKVAAAIAISSGLLMGCNGPTVVDETGGSGSGGGTTPTSPLVGGSWDFGDTSDVAATANSTDLPNVYVFDGNNVQKYYNDDATPGTYVISEDTYTDGFENDPKTIDFVYYDTNGANDITGATFTVTDGNLVIDTANFDELSAVKSTDTAVADAVKAANALAGDFPSAVHEFKFSNGDATTDSGSAASDSMKWTGSATLTSTTGSTGTAGTATDVDQDTVGKGYAYYTADGTTGADLIEGSFSIETVINRDRANTKDVALVDYADTSNYLGYKLYIESNDDTLKFKVYGGQIDGSNLSTEAVSSVSINNDEWYHIAAVYDDTESEATIYLDGQLVATKSVNWDLAKNSADKFILLGGSSEDDKNFDGQVDNIGLWNVALTAEQIAERATQFSAQ